MHIHTEHKIQSDSQGFGEERKLDPELERPVSPQTLRSTADTPVRKMVLTPSDAVLTEPKGLCSDQSVPRTGVG